RTERSPRQAGASKRGVPGCARTPPPIRRSATATASDEAPALRQIGEVVRIGTGVQLLGEEPHGQGRDLDGDVERLLHVGGAHALTQAFGSGDEGAELVEGDEP